MSTDDDQDVRDLLQLPEDATTWTADQLARWLADRLEETLLRLQESTQRERALMRGLKLIAFEHEFCEACGQVEGDKCLSPGRCRFSVPTGRSVAAQVLSGHKAMLTGELDSLEEPRIVVSH